MIPEGPRHRRGRATRRAFSGFAALAVLVVALAPRPARADDGEPAPAPARPGPDASTPLPPLTFVWDPKLGTEAGIRTADSLSRVLFRYDEALRPLVRIDERSAPVRLLAAAFRLAQYFFVDSALASFEQTVLHEVFGHGSRARDLRQSTQFDFALPGIYCAILGDGDNCTSHAQTPRPGRARDRSTLVDAGGIEANLLTGHFLELRMVQSRGWMHQGDLLVYSLSKLAYYDSFLSGDLERAGTMKGSNDVANYVSDLQDRFDRPRPEDRRTIASRLRTGYLWNLADPVLWYSVYASIANGVARGERRSRFPLPTIAGTALLATPRFGLTPFGAEHYVDVFAAHGRSALSLYGRVGSSGLASYTGAGGRVVGIPVNRNLSLGAELDVWSQPQILLDDRSVYDRPQRRGINAGLVGNLRVWNSLALTGRFAYKTAGYLAGQPVTEGAYGYLGFSVDAP